MIAIDTDMENTRMDAPRNVHDKKMITSLQLDFQISLRKNPCKRIPVNPLAVQRTVTYTIPGKGEAKNSRTFFFSTNNGC
ncbi:hypothetical protein D3C73_565510 [compost metagenome]